MWHMTYRGLHAVAFCLLFANVAGANDLKCARCGATTACQKVGHAVAEEKKVDVVCWGAKCEGFSVPGPSQPGCRNCDNVCGSTDESVHAACKKFVWREWLPGRAQVYTKKKLMKKTVTQKVPSYKWVVEPLCSQCASQVDAASAESGKLVN